MPLRFAQPAEAAYRYPLLIRHLLHTPLATAPRQEIVYREHARYTYLTLAERIARLGAALSRIGVQPGDTVAVMEWDSPRYLECFFAIPMLGAVLQTVNVRLQPAQIAYTLNHARATVLLAHRDFLPLVSELRPSLTQCRAIVVMTDDLDPSGPAWIDAEYESLLQSASPEFQFDDFDENAIATTFYTTGTTGEPKGVCFSHRQIVLHSLALLGAVASPAFGQSFRHGDVYMPMTPMFHVHAWGNPYVATLLGVKQVYPGRYAAKDLLALRAREGVTFSHCVPTILQMLLETATASAADLRGWKICIGGSALSVGLARAALGLGIDVYAGYGMSETGPVVSVASLNSEPEVPPTDHELAQRCRAGRPIPLVDLKVLDAAGAELPWDDVSSGEIVVRSPWTTPCYVDSPDASEALWAGGYLHTQDVGRLDREGSLRITDRMKDVIKTGGEWLSSLDIENLISAHPDVAEVAVIAVADALWGERPHALVVLRQDCATRPATTDIQCLVAAAAAKGRIARFAVPERVTFVEALDRTSVGKVDKRKLRDHYDRPVCDRPKD